MNRDDKLKVTMIYRDDNATEVSKYSNLDELCDEAYEVFISEGWVSNIDTKEMTVDLYDNSDELIGTGYIEPIRNTKRKTYDELILEIQ